MELVEKTPTNKGPEAWFTGDVYFNVYYAGQEPSRARLNIVRFAPSARTAWHWHAQGQTLHCTEGAGYVVTHDGVIALRPGDTVWTPPGEWHWHGACPDQFMSHLALWEAGAPDAAGPDTTWGELVTDAEYDAAASGRTTPRPTLD